jgi:hypothetical protein
LISRTSTQLLRLFQAGLVLTGLFAFAIPSNAAPDPNEVVVAGSFKSVPGLGDWSTDNPAMRMTIQKSGVYTLAVKLPAGAYEYKIAKGGTWTKNWGAGFKPDGPNITLKVTKSSLVRFVVDFNKKQIMDSVDNLPR